MAVRRRARVPVQQPADPRRDCIPVPPVFYDDDGYPVEDSVGQSQTHSEQTTDWHGALLAWCRRNGLGEVFSDLFMPYLQGQRNKVVCPDLMVALKAERLQERPSYKLWEHPTPDFALEALSNSTWKGDVAEKKRLYRSLGVSEYWLFDPSGKRLGEPLRGYRLRRRAVTPEGRTVHGYVRIRENRSGRRESQVLRLHLCVMDGALRFYDPLEDRLLPTVEESDTLVRAAEANAHEAEANAREAQAKAREAEARAREAQTERDAEREYTQAAESRIAALEAQLKALRQSDSNDGGTP